MLRNLRITVFCAHCAQRAPLRACSSDDNIWHDVYWPNNWMGFYDGTGFFTKCSNCYARFPPRAHEITYCGVLVVGPLTERAIWASPIKVGSKIDFRYNISENGRFSGTSNAPKSISSVGSGNIHKRRHSTGSNTLGLSLWL